MPFIPIANVVRVNINYTWGTREMANVLYMQHATAPVSVTDAEDMAADIEAAWAAEVMPNLVDDVAMASVVVTDASSETGVQATQVSTAVGGSSSEPLPPNNAVCVTIRSNLRSRNGRGRIFLPGIGEDKVSGDGTILSTFRTGMITAMNDVATALGAATIPLTMGVASFYSKSVNPTPPHERAAGVFSPLSSFTIDATIDTQRRRLR